MPEIIRKPSMKLGVFAEFLKLHCQGDWWDKVLPVLPDPEHGACESCTWHPLTEKHASILNRIFNAVKDAGGPSPHAAYAHCSAELIIEWHSDDNQNAVILDITDKWGWSALIRLLPTPTYFVNVIDPDKPEAANEAGGSSDVRPDAIHNEPVGGSADELAGTSQGPNP